MLERSCWMFFSITIIVEVCRLSIIENRINQIMVSAQVNKHLTSQYFSDIYFLGGCYFPSSEEVHLERCLS